MEKKKEHILLLICTSVLFYPISITKYGISSHLVIKELQIYLVCFHVLLIFGWRGKTYQSSKALET